jgi:hypothetical protein
MSFSNPNESGEEQTMNNQNSEEKPAGSPSGAPSQGDVIEAKVKAKEAKRQAVESAEQVREDMQEKIDALDETVEKLDKLVNAVYTNVDGLNGDMPCMHEANRDANEQGQQIVIGGRDDAE